MQKADVTALACEKVAGLELDGASKLHCVVLVKLKRLSHFICLCHLNVLC